MDSGDDTPIAKAYGFQTFVSNVGLCPKLYSVQVVGDTSWFALEQTHTIHSERVSRYCLLH